MSTCDAVYRYLVGVTNRSVPSSLPAGDSDLLTRLGLIQVWTADQYSAATQQVADLGNAQSQVQAETAQRAQIADAVSEDERQDHSVLFLFEGKNKKAAAAEKEQRDRAALQTTDAELTQRQQAFNTLLAQRSMLDAMVPSGTNYVALTPLGMTGLRDLGVRLYRASDMEFSAYWTQAQQISADLARLGDRSAQFFAGVAPPLGPVDRAYLWSIAIGLAGQPEGPDVGVPRFLDAYSRLANLSGNAENRLLAAEIVTSLKRELPDSVASLRDLQKTVQTLGVPRESSLGVSATLLFGQRADATFATESLGIFLHQTRSYDAAAILAIVNQEYAPLAQKFGALRQLFGSWGFAESDDVELASAYLAVSELPIEGINTKLAILSKGLQSYLQFPLVAAAVLASIPVLEANETLNLLEHAYDAIGRRAMPLSQPELITLAVRMVHGVRNETLGSLDATAASRPAPSVGYRGPVGYYGVPMFVFYGAYFSTYSGYSGAHPGHAHFGPGGFGGAGGMVG
jgi:hypothetical protein